MFEKGIGVASGVTGKVLPFFMEGDYSGVYLIIMY